MPSLTAFHRGFKIETGMNIQGYALQELSIDHIVISRYHRYEFPIVMVFIPSSSATSSSSLLQALKRLVQGNKRIIYSEYGSPYECSFGTPVVKEHGEDGDVIIESRGTAVRVYTVPTQQQEAKGVRAQDIKGYIPPDQIESITDQLSDKYRVLKSHFSTGRCSICTESIHAGILIGQPLPQSDEYHHRSGNWSHATCLLGPRHGVRGRSSKSATLSSSASTVRSKSHSRSRPTTTNPPSSSSASQGATVLRTPPKISNRSRSKTDDNSSATGKHRRSVSRKR